MNEDDLRKLLQRTASDPGPPSAWSVFLETARRRRKLRMAAGGGAVAMALIVALAVFVLAGRETPNERPKPANSEEASPDEERTTEVRRGDRVIDENEDAIEEALEPISDGGRQGRSGTPGRPDPGDEVTSPPREPRGTEKEPRDVPGAKPAPTNATCRGEPATVTGTSGRDGLVGTAGPDVIAAGAGNDVVNGAGGDDLVCGGLGADNLSGGPGDDNLAGDAGDDVIDGGAGFDFLIFPNSPRPVDIQLLEGTVEGDGEDAVEAVEGAVGTRFENVMFADHGDNVFIGEGGADFISMQRGDDLVYPGAGSDFASGSRGRDTLAFVASGWTPGSRGVEIDLPRGRVIGEGNDQISLIENATGTAGDDVFNGGERENVFRGLDGNDTALGAVSDDALFGGPGDDKLDGGMGNDLLNGGDGTDTCLNGEGGGSCEAGTAFASFVILGLLAARLVRRRRSR